MIPQRGAAEALFHKHPCFDPDAHFRYGRLHLPVSPSCNIQCRYCSNGSNKCAGPDALVAPEQAVELVARALELCPQLTVVGVSGPGDPLATGDALEALERVHREFPALIKCLSTNGLMLVDRAERIAAAGVKTVAVTVNALRYDLLKQICSYVLLNGKYYTGDYAARLLISAQLAGIRKLIGFGIAVKINTVLIPGVNDRHIGEIAKVMAQLGAALINIVPLYPGHYPSAFQVPSPLQLHEARQAAQAYLPVSQFCRLCQADACGIPGTGPDQAELLYQSDENLSTHG
ncbi:nitrogen fixation protein NifB [Hydrogenispora ethanolica]|uniref:FeMo cofactor biosynthesis protein NifB n=1 Tax=Hydrogenispora ethanolica TaxID=1082276 RepID=A0A4R1QRD1_HYDET|nr:radical SAM protein [Hydrogenispora ethanolica]TCL55571.1 nitrogen fixation protein NifB [Hydrogenispora ethanolica]